jgi:hypothetical protein
MFSFRTPADRLAAALTAYQKDFEKKLKSEPNPDAVEARERMKRAEDLVRQSGLGKALEVLLEQTKYWPSWLERDDFRTWIGFPVGEALAKEQWDEEGFGRSKAVIACFTYQGGQYASVFKDKGGTGLPDGEVYYSGTVEFISNSETVLGLNISQDRGAFASDWRYNSVYALKMGAWSKVLLEIAAHIRAHKRDLSIRSDEKRVMEQAKKISI